MAEAFRDQFEALTARAGALAVAAWDGIRRGSGRVSGSTVRSRRVSVLVLAFVVLGVADLALTLAYMHTVGLFEGNPLARALAQSGGSASLAAFKIVTIALSSVILLALRTHRAAELGAWVCAVAMCLVSLQWGQYAVASEEVVLAMQIVDSPFGPQDHYINLRR